MSEKMSEKCNNKKCHNLESRNRTDMRRNTRIMLVFGLIWFSGVLYYARHASEQEDDSTNRHNPKHGAHVEKREHSK